MKITANHIFWSAFLVLAFGITYLIVGVAHDTQACLVKFANRDAEGTTVLRQASKKKDYWDHEVKRLAIDRKLPLSDPRVHRAWVKYEDAYQDLMKARQDNPAPRFRCGDNK